MRRSAIVLFAALAGMATAGVSPLHAQYYYRYPPPYGPPPGYGPPAYGPPPGYYPPPDYDRPCPRGFTVQDGVCKPYRGPTGGGGWRTWNGCPPGFTVQGGECRPYRGR